LLAVKATRSSPALPADGYVDSASGYNRKNSILAALHTQAGPVPYKLAMLPDDAGTDEAIAQATCKKYFWSS